MIERIIIENFKSIRKLDLELKPINILIGANGAGKSNFVSFFKLFIDICSVGVSKKNIAKLFHFGSKKSSYIKGIFDFDNKYAFQFSIEANESNDAKVTAFGVYSNQNNNKKKDYGNWKNLIKDQAIKLRPSAIRTGGFGKLVSNIAKKYFESFGIYHFHDTGKNSPLKKINKLDDNDFLREDGENLAAFLYYLQEKHPKEFNNIENQIRSVAPFFDRFNLVPRKLNEEEIRLRWFEKGADGYFDAYDLSDGTLRFMALTTLLLQPDLPKTIIIDEPELGLHPFAINKLAAMIKQAAAKRSQVIVSTQSVSLIDNFEPEDVIAVDREDDQSVFRRLNSEDLKDWLEDYTLGDLWNKNVIGARP